ncbi:uncharacterized protein LOC118471071 isoform X1 [Amphiprion ocellaris]|uniref:uncharacterized protein LOC118471071 isoform X1 n=1 Tax=Amphiprion ocellaris TaxID=80972 RepID=UPI0024110363|nr:uncharacterized protein LOC118471071 isoform X1 [Amphiprion ocellaris]
MESITLPSSDECQLVELSCDRTLRKKFTEANSSHLLPAFVRSSKSGQWTAFAETMRLGRASAFRSEVTRVQKSAWWLWTTLCIFSTRPDSHRGSPAVSRQYQKETLC